MVVDHGPSRRCPVSRSIVNRVKSPYLGKNLKRINQSSGRRANSARLLLRARVPSCGVEKSPSSAYISRVPTSLPSQGLVQADSTQFLVSFLLGRLAAAVASGLLSPTTGPPEPGSSRPSAQIRSAFSIASSSAAALATAASARASEAAKAVFSA